MPQNPAASVTITAPQLVAWQGKPSPYTVSLAVSGYKNTVIPVLDDQGIDNPASHSVLVSGSLLGGHPIPPGGPVFGLNEFTLTLYYPATIGPISVIARTPVEGG